MPTRVLTDPPSRVVVAQIPGKGRGVVASNAIEGGALVMSDPVLVISAADELARLGETRLDHWLLYWDEGAVCVALGWTMLINHSRRPELRNVTTQRDAERGLIHVHATRDIAAGEELLFDYELSDAELAAYGIPPDA